MKLRAKTLLAVPTAAIAATLTFAGTALGWHITSTCGNGQWTVGLPDESWADGTTAKFDFDLEHTGEELFMTRGQSHAAPADATFVFVTYSNTDEQTAAYRPEGCPVVVAVTPTTTTVTPTTLAATTTTMSSVAVVTLDTPPPAALQAVDVPPVPQPQGVSAAGGQTLPATGGGSSLLLAGGIAVAAGAVAMLVARRRVA